MKKEFIELIDIYGISKEEVSQLDKVYDSIEDLKKSLYSNDISFLKTKDNERLKKHFNIQEHKPNQDKKVKEIISDEKLCISCKIKLSKRLDKGICTFCGIRNKQW